MRLTLLARFGVLTIIVVTSCLACKTTQKTRSEEAEKYLKIANGYADKMISEGRDNYGKVHSPLFASALDRQTMKPGTRESFGSIPGVRESDRSLGGANPLCDIGLFEILYKLSEINKDPRYANEADSTLKYFFTHCQSPNTGLMAWGEHLFWDFRIDSAGGRGEHEMSPWPFWDRCYELAPVPCRNFAVGLWDHQIADHVTGDFSRHALWAEHHPYKGFEFPRYAGQMIEVWADAYKRQPDEIFVNATRVIFNRMKQNRDPVAGTIHAGTDPSHFPGSWPGSDLELARCLWEAANFFPKDLADEMKTFAREIDQRFLLYPHDLKNKGFVTTVEAASGKPGWRKPYYSNLFSTAYGIINNAGCSKGLFLRYQQLKEAGIPDTSNFLQLVISAADGYLTVMPDTTQLLKPDSYASIIELMLNVYDITKDIKYLNRAVVYANQGIMLFFDDSSPLPKATNHHSHYETITGGADFAKVLLDLSTNL